MSQTDFSLGGAPASIAESRPWALSYGAIGPAALGLDMLGILATSVLAGAGYHLFATGTLGDFREFASLGALVVALVVPLLHLRGLYQTAGLLAGRSQFLDIALVWVAVFLFLAVLAFGLKSGASFSRGYVFLFFSLGLVVLIGQRDVWRRTLSRAVASGKLRTRKAVLLGNPTALSDDRYHAKLTRHAIEVVRRFPLLLEAGAAETGETRTAVEEVLSYLRGSGIDEVLVIGGWAQWRQIQGLLSTLQAVPLPVRLLPDTSLAELIGRPLSYLGALPTLELQRAPLGRMERGLKRASDVVLAGFGIVALSPILAAVALAVRWDSRGPVIFRQTRHGFNGTPFEIYKFRSMTVLENGSTITQATRNDPRVTRVGRWLRRTSIDELPQLFNVLKGDMSLIGPRPHAVAHDDYYDRLIANYAHRQHVKPGITGWAQVNGCRGETASVELMERRVELDLWYVANWSFWLDIKIIFRTTIDLLVNRSAY